MKGWLDKYGKEINANEGRSSASKEWVGEGYSNVGRDYSPAWGGQFAMGGSLPGSVGFTYARTGSIPSNGPYAKKTKASAQKGKEIPYHPITNPEGYHLQNTLDKIKKLSNKEKRYEPSDAVKNLKSTLSVASLAGAGNPLTQYLAQVAGGTGDLYTAGRYAADKNWNKAGEDFVQGALGFIPYAKAIPGMKIGTDYFTKGARLFNRILKTGHNASDIKTLTESPTSSYPVQENGGMTYYQNGLDWKPKSMEKGGWLEKYEVPKNQNAEYVLPRFDMPRAASESTSRVVNNTITGKQKSTATTGQKNKDIKSSTSDMGKAKKREEQEKQERIAERKAAKAFNEGKSKTFTLPTGETKTLDQMDWREKAYVSGKSVEGKGRLNENDETWYDDWINPVNWITEAAGGLGTAPYEAKAYDSNLPYVGAIASPLFMGRMMGSNSVNPFGKKFWTNEVSNKEFINNMLGDIPSMTKNLTRGAINLADRNLSSVGRNLAKIEKEGEAAGLNPFEIAQKQMKKVGITSNQRQGYIPGVSELAYKYVRPKGYEGIGDGNKFSEIVNNIKKGGYKIKDNERLDAWNLYLGMPQKNKTFSLANTSPGLHPSYPAGSLEGMDIYNLNYMDDYKVRPDYSYYGDLEHSKILEKLDRPIILDRDNYVMGGFNTRMTKSGTEYNDVWDLEPGISLRSLVPKKVSEHPMLDNVFFKKKTVNGVETATPRGIKLRVDNFVGKPFMSHGVSPFTSNDYVNQINERIQSLIKDMPEDVWNRQGRISDLQKDLEIMKNYPKQKKGGIIKDDMGQWAHPGEITEIGSNQITMKGVSYPVLGISDTGDQQMMYPEQEYKFKGKKVTEYPMAQNGRATRADSLALYNNAMLLKGFYDKLAPYYEKPEIGELQSYDKKEIESGKTQRETLLHPSVTPQNKAIIRANKDPNVTYLSDIITGGIDPAAPLLRYDKRIKPQGSINYNPRMIMSSIYDIADRFPKDKDKIMSLIVGYHAQEKWKDPLDRYINKADKEYLFKKYKLNDSSLRYMTRQQVDIEKHTPGLATTIPYYDPIAVKPFDLLTPQEKQQRLKTYGKNPEPKTTTQTTTKPQPSLKVDKSKAKTISTERKTPSGKIIERTSPNATLPPIQNLPYRVDYIGEDGKPTHTNFASNKEGEAFMKEIQNRPMGISGSLPGGSIEGYYENLPKKKKGGWLEKYK